MKRLRLAPWAPVTAYQIFGVTHNALSDLIIRWPGDNGESKDFLTGVPNRQMYDLALSQAVSESAVQNAGFGLIVFDLDKFKAINDQYGHQTGDEVLREFTRRVKGVLREEDFFARYGGEEFVLLTTCHTKVFEIGERVREAICHAPFLQNKVELKVTCSFGCAIYPVDGVSTYEVFQKADKALYKAKANGRNQGQRGADE